MRGEFGFLKDLKNHFNLSMIGDDCAVIPKDETHDHLITSDLLVEDIDFRLQWNTPNSLGHKALAVSLSDISAMGGIPLYSLLSIAIPDRHWNTSFLDEFYDGYMEAAGEASVELIGGDVSRTTDEIVIDSTVVGKVTRGKAILRSGAKPGDGIFVTGALGGAAGGLQLLEAGLRMSDNLDAWQKLLIERQIQPIAKSGINLIGVATSMIDISDGLSSDLKHICEASRVGARLFHDKIPIQPELANLLDNENSRLEMALHGGEDFELLFTAESDSRFAPVFNCRLIGETTNDPDIFQIRSNSEDITLDPAGYQHFGLRSSD